MRLKHEKFNEKFPSSMLTYLKRNEEIDLTRYKESIHLNLENKSPIRFQSSNSFHQKKKDTDVSNNHKLSNKSIIIEPNFHKQRA